MSTPPPRSAPDIFAESLRLSPKQREVLAVLQTYPKGAKAVEIAAELGMHVNTVRGHLEELIAQEAVRTVTAPATGRGRPSLIFQVRVPDNRAVAHEYISLIEVLARSLGDSAHPDAEAIARAKAIGAQWAIHMNTTNHEWKGLEEPLNELFHKLREMGYDPHTAEQQEDRAELSLLSCPFIIGEQRPSPFICAIHEGFLQESVGAQGPMKISIRPFDGPGRCSVNFQLEGKQNPEVSAE
ncbi:MarR family protein [Corynebacterium occultum]|uniref:MarR family protein n=1 Tax=Corynebacterium occultum TaxID=2675219 RepID=A0A6B8WAP9_9CORY|nr:MarR family transcriptional regulator [Corynebacterium occultum]QGU07070.1 MarR family protein [Corynebacterium occultum]